MVRVAPLVVLIMLSASIEARADTVTVAFGSRTIRCSVTLTRVADSIAVKIDVHNVSADTLVVLDTGRIEMGFFHRRAEYLNREDSVPGVEAGGNERTFIIDMSESHYPWPIHRDPVPVMTVVPGGRYELSRSHVISPLDMSYGREYRRFATVVTFTWVGLAELRKLFRHWERLEELEEWEQFGPDQDIPYLVSLGALKDAGGVTYTASVGR